ncbi:recombinase RecF [Mesorhizobium sp. L2C054A000]|nr:AAA family ATPase [Mesorhizobium sp. L2C054A000]ESZ53014.1 recombinase RecF [Mesorhizobium sp. L2C054A000]
MHIKSIVIEDIGGIRHLSINFSPGMNVLCGPNGIGKTTILECVAHSFTTTQSQILKRNAQASEGSVSIRLDIDETETNHKFTLNEFSPVKNSSVTGLHNFANKLLSLKVTRSLNYMQIDAIRTDLERPVHIMYEEAKNGINTYEFKNWFVNRHMWSKHENSLTEQQMSNYHLAVKSFSILDKDYQFSRILADSNEIMLNSPRGEIFYEYLSSGFKSTLSVIFGIIKEIEFRFKDPHVKAEDFDGVILIDELELHLHPDWQARIPNVLRSLFPKCQFIATTHSPHIIQAADPNEIIALEGSDGHTVQRQLPNAEFGFKGWTIEEVLSDVMGMSDTRTKQFDENLAEFNAAIDGTDAERAEQAFSKLNKMIHPANQLRKLLRLQLASIRID